MKMKSLTVNERKFHVCDGEAVHHNEDQKLTPEEQAKARENIGAAGTEEVIATLTELHTPVIVNVLPYGKDVPYTIDTDNGNIYWMFSQGIPVYLSYHTGNIPHKVPAPLIYATETVAYFSAASANGIVTYTIDNGAFSCTTTHQVFDSVLIGDEENEDKPTAYPGALVTQKAVYDYVNSVMGNSGHANYKNLYGRVSITADDIAAAGDEGITCLTIGSNEVDLSQYDDILIRLYVPANEELNPETGALRVHATNTANFVQESRNELLKVQSLGISTVCGVQKSANTPFAIKMMFAGDTFLYGQVMRNGYSNAHGYAGAMNTWTSIADSMIKSQKKYFHISAYCLTNKVKFKFPAGSYMEVYGR